MKLKVIDKKSKVNTSLQNGLLLMLFLVCTTLMAGPPAEDSFERQDFANRLREQGGGVLLTMAGTPEHSPAQRTRAYLQGVLENLAGNLIRSRGIQIRVNLYSSLEPNAFAMGGTNHEYLGLADDGKPIFEIGVSQGMLALFRSEDEIAFILGHELGHIALNHLSRDETEESGFISHWYSSQTTEVEADFFALNTMAGRYEMNAAYSLMERLLPAKAHDIFLNDVLSSHHHPSIRLASLLGKIQQLRRMNFSAVVRPESPMPKNILSFARAERTALRSEDDENYREEYKKWFDRLMQPRTEPFPVDYKMFQEFRILTDTQDEKMMNRLFAESLASIASMSDLEPRHRVARVLELLTVYKKINVKVTGPRLVDAISKLSAQNLEQLSHTLRNLTLQANRAAGKGGRWDAHAIVALLESRVVFPSYQALRFAGAELRTIFSMPGVGGVLNRLAAGSPQWADLRDSLYSVRRGMSIEKILQSISENLHDPPGDPQSSRVLESLDQIHFADFHEKLSDLKQLSALFALESRFSNCKWPALCGKLREVFGREIPAFKQVLLSRLDFLLAKPSLTDSEIQEFNYLLSPVSGASVVLSPSDTLAYSRRMVEFFKRSSEEISSYELMALRNQIMVHVIHALTHGVWPESEVIGVYRRLRDQTVLMEIPTEPFLRRRSSTELRNLILAIPSPLVQNGELRTDLSAYLGVPEPEILGTAFKDNTLHFEIPDLRREGKIIYDRKHRELHSKIKQIIDNYESSGERVVHDVIRDSQTAQAVLPTLSNTEFFTFLKDVRRRERETHWIKSLCSVVEDTRFYSPEPRYGQFESNLMQSLVERQSGEMTFPQWREAFSNIITNRKSFVDLITHTQRVALAEYLVRNLNSLSAPERMDILKQQQFLSLLPPEHGARYLADGYLAELPHSASLETKAQRFTELQESFELPAEYPETNHFLEMQVAERLRLQPTQLDRFLEKGHAANKAQNFENHLRGLSGIVAHSQKKSIAEQMELIEYMLGRRDQMPEWVHQTKKYLEEKLDGVDFSGMIAAARSRLVKESVMNRAMAILPFYTGPNSMLGRPEGTQVLLDQVLSSISTGRRPLAMELARGILQGEGRNAPLAFALLFAQRGEGGGAMSESDVFRSLFHGYGVPGAKFGQYLAFTSELQSLRESLSSLQDQAMPISYLDSIRLLETHFPKGLPLGLEVVGVKGSGSVNIGIEYYNPTSRTQEVMSVSRDEVQAATREDFRRLRNVIGALTQSEEGKTRYGFMLGLDEIIQQSVELEFNRNQVFENHRQLHKILNRTVDGWQVRMVEPHAIENEVIFMQMAKGTPARIVETKNPVLYRKAMHAASTVVTDHLMQRDQATEHFADSDFHNGQVFIDERTRTVWLIDPGQAVPINAEEFSMAKQVLRIISHTMTPENALSYLNRSSLNPAPGTAFLTAEDLRAPFASTQPADAFIKIIGIVKQRGGHVPLPVVQWVLGMNRQIALSQHLGFGLDARLFGTFLMEPLRDLASGQSAVACMRDALQTLSVGFSAIKRRGR